MSESKLPLWSRSVAAALAVSLGMSLLACQSSDPETLMAEARQHRDRGDIKAAIIQLKNLIEHNAANRAARLMLAELYLDQGDPQSAEKELRRALALGADSAAASLMLGRALLMQGQYERLLADVGAASAPALRPASLAMRGNALLGMGKTEPARAVFNEALRLNPDSPEARLGLARLAMWERQPDVARPLLARALASSPFDADCLRYHAELLRAEGKPELALAEQAKILQRHPHNVQALADSAALHTDAGRYSQARALLAKARKVAGSSVALAHAQAMLEFRENRLDAALEGVQQVLRAAPGHDPSVLLAASIHAALGQHQSAELHARAFLQAHPGHLYASKLLAGAHLGAQQADAALAVLGPLLAAHPKDAELLALAGEASLRARRFSQAAGFFEQASALRPDAAALHTGLALSRMAGGDSDSAVAELERAARLDRDPARTGVLLVMTYLRARQPDKALKAVLDMEKQGDNPLVQNLKGGIYLARQDFPGARACFERALALDPAYLPALANLAQLDRNEQRSAATRARYLAALARAPGNSGLLEALAELALASGDPHAALRYMERAGAASPESLALALRSAALYLKLGQSQKALSLAQRLQASNPASPDALSLLGQAYTASKYYAQAAETYARWAALAPQAGAPHLQLAGVRIAQNQAEAALAALRKALALEPGLLDARITLVNLLVRQKNFDEALGAAAQARKQFPDSAAGNKLEGDVHAARGQYAAALTSYEQALAIAPGGALLVQVYATLARLGRQADADARMALWFKDHPGDVPTRLYVASSKLVGNDPKGAVPHFEAVLKADPANLAALNDLAWSYQRLGERRALEFALRAHQLAPDNPAVMDTLGWIYLEQGQLARSLPLLQKASMLAPAAGEIHYHYGMLLARSGDRKGARRALEKALAAPLPFAGREDAQALLGTL